MCLIFGFGFLVEFEGIFAYGQFFCPLSVRDPASACSHVNGCGVFLRIVLGSQLPVTFDLQRHGLEPYWTISLSSLK